MPQALFVPARLSKPVKLISLPLFTMPGNYLTSAYGPAYHYIGASIYCAYAVPNPPANNPRVLGWLQNIVAEEKRLQLDDMVVGNCEEVPGDCIIAGQLSGSEHPDVEREVVDYFMGLQLSIQIEL